ncbi:type VII secretion target [Actinoplanes sp. NBC_00393]|uniref:type VII secretion target n=1 Tax=Actinoplanes sp. NBC_00393 TaxID=2975953 RepID=UPI002E1CDF3B
MTIKVETEYLRGYATRLENNADLALEQLAGYVRQHCFDMTGLNGVLDKIQPSLTEVAQGMVDLIGAFQQALRRTADNLRRSADAYDETDYGNAEQIWIRIGEGHMPRTWVGRDVASAGPTTSGGALLYLDAPVFTPEIGEVTEAIGGGFELAISAIKKFTGYDVMAELGPVLLGDWGALRRIGAAWNEVEEAWRAVAVDVSAGMDVLSDHWDSSPLDALGASRAFDHHIRARWMTALDAAAQQADAMEQICEYLADMYEHTVKSIIWMVQVALERVMKMIKSLMMVRNLKQFAEAVWEVGADLIGLIQDGIELAIGQVQMFAQGAQMSGSALRMLRNEADGDFGVLQGG